MNIGDALSMYITTGFPLNTLSKIINIPLEQLEKIASGQNIDRIALATDDITYLHIFLSQLFEVHPLDDCFLPEHINSLTSYFGLSLKSIATYIGTSEAELKKALSDGNTRVLKEHSTEIMHLFSVFSRNRQLSFTQITKN